MLTGCVTQPLIFFLFRYVEHIPFDFNRTFTGDWTHVLAKELYDHRNGTHAENANLAAKPEMAKTVARLQGILRQGWRAAKFNSSSSNSVTYLKS